MSTPFRLEALGEAHVRSSFHCGEEALDRYFKEQVTQDVRRHITNCFVAIEVASEQLAAFYTLASTSVLMLDLPSATTRRLPRYPTVPAVRIGRLAVDRRFQGRGLGAALLADAARRSLHGAAASFALVVDAKNDRAAAFYAHHGFMALADQPRTLFLPIATAAKAFFTAGS